MSYLGNAGQLLVNTLFSLVMILLILRILLQATGANFYNPICQLLHSATQPLIGPARRLIPPIGRIETAGVALVWLVALLKFYAFGALAGGFLPFPALAVLALADGLSMLLWILFGLLLIGVILSWIPVDDRNPAVPLVYQITEPLLAPIRRVLPSMGLDLSPIVAFLGLQLARLLIVHPLYDLAGRLALGA